MKEQWSKCDGAEGCPTWHEIEQLGDRIDALPESKKAQERQVEVDDERAIKATQKTKAEEQCRTSIEACQSLIAELDTEREACGSPSIPACYSIVQNKRKAQEYLRELRAKAAHEEKDRERAGWEKKRAEAEQQRLEDRQKREAFLVRAQGIVKDPKEASVLVSVLICKQQREISGLRADLSRERAIEAKGGIQDLGERRSIAESMQGAEDDIRDLRGSLASRHLSARPCGSIKSTIECVSSTAECSAEDALRRDVLDVAERFLRDPTGSEQP